MVQNNNPDWLKTPDGEARGYIQPAKLTELWFHTGTACNLACPFCLEGSSPGDKRIESITFDEAKKFIDEATNYEIEQYSFTGGEPFINHDFLKILEYALEHRPCLVLTNATAPVKAKLPEILSLRSKPHPVKFRVSLDFPDPEKHDSSRGEGNFQRALDTMGELHQAGFSVSIARQEMEDEDREKVNQAYHPFFSSVGVPLDIPIVVFPNLLPPGSLPNIPYVTESCMTTYKDEKSRAEFMCNYSKMIVKKGGKLGVYACTLVDDDPDYDLAESLSEAMKVRVMLKHHRCYSCFAFGTSCSEKSKELSPA